MHNLSALRQCSVWNLLFLSVTSWSSGKQPGGHEEAQRGAAAQRGGGARRPARLAGQHVEDASRHAEHAVATTAELQQEVCARSIKYI